MVAWRESRKQQNNNLDSKPCAIIAMANVLGLFVLGDYRLAKQNVGEGLFFVMHGA